MRPIEWITLTLLLLVSGCVVFDQQAKHPVSLTPVWTVDGFLEPESAVIDSDRQFVYVTNVNGYALDGNGFVSRVSLDGQQVEQEWITGINSPTGIALHDGNLYFADVNALVIADATSGQIISRINAADASQQPVLNDVAITKDGRVFVTGSRSRTIYVLDNQELSPWVIDKSALETANGLFVDGTQLVQGGKYWLSFNLESAKQEQNRIAVPNDLTEFDGITSDGNNGYLVTLIEDDRIWHIAPQGAAPVSDEPWQGIDLHLKGKLLAVPRVGGKLTLFTID